MKERDFLSRLPWVGRLSPCWGDIESVLAIKEDFPHQKFHSWQVGQFGLWIAESLGMSEGEKERIREAAKLHDSGYKLVQLGFLKPEQHHLCSAFIALRLHSDPSFAWGIFLHSRDRLPFGTPDWVRALRDADRVAGMGWTGVIREAFYMGFRLDLPTRPFLYDPRPPWLAESTYRYRTTRYFPSSFVPSYLTSTDYEKEARRFCLEYVFPSLYARDLIQEMKEHCRTWLGRFYGVPRRVNKWDQVSSWKVEPVMSIAQVLFELKAFNTQEAIGLLSEFESRREKQGLRQLNFWPAMV